MGRRGGGLLLLAACAGKPRRLALSSLLPPGKPPDGGGDAAGSDGNTRQESTCCSMSTWGDATAGGSFGAPFEPPPARRAVALLLAFDWLSGGLGGGKRDVRLAAGALLGRAAEGKAVGLAAASAAVEAPSWSATAAVDAAAASSGTGPWLTARFAKAAARRPRGGPAGVTAAAAVRWRQVTLRLPGVVAGAATAAVAGRRAPSAAPRRAVEERDRCGLTCSFEWGSTGAAAPLVPGGGCGEGGDGGSRLPRPYGVAAAVPLTQRSSAAADADCV